MNPSVVEITFKVHADLDFGEEVYISGNVPGLGSGDLNRAVQLVTSSSTFPWWSTKEAILLPAAADVQYRYCIFSGGQFSRWESEDGQFRVLDINKGKGFSRSTLDRFGDLNYVFSVQDASSMKTTMIGNTDPQRAKVCSSWNPLSLGKDEIGPEDAVNARLLWVGSIRYGNAPIPVEEEEAVASVLAAMNCYPVFINQTMHYQFYDIFCKQNLWLVMHHVADVYGPLNQNEIGAKAQQNLWFNYSTVHKLFREKVLEVYQQNYLIWIHGFHLMLLPSFLRRRIPLAKIGYYFHTPFPSSELWRTMARREDLLRGILGANQIGFHLFEYARHFLTVCHRILGYSNDTNAQGMMTVNVDGREVVITCIHVGVDMPRVTEILESPSYVAEVKEWKERFANKIVVSGIDRLERLKGIPLRLMAIDQFLEENPQYVGKVVFAFIGISAGERGQDYRQTQHDVRVLVGRLNEKYGQDGGAMFYFEERHDKDIRLAQRLAYFSAVDILMMTATRDGLNRYPMEFTLARKKHGDLVSAGILPKEERLLGAGLPNQGLVIISEFISSARVMRGAMVINPWRVDEVKLALRHAFEIDDLERADRCRRNLEFSTRLTTANWAKHVLRDLKSVEVSSDPNSSYGVGFGMQFKIMNLKSGFLPLDTKEICKTYRNARHRLILLDWGGTIVANVHKADKLHAYALATGAASREGLTTELKDVLEALCSDIKNIVFVVSGKESHIVADYFGSLRGLGLAGEHGFYYKWPRDEINRELGGFSVANKGKWQSIQEMVDDSWKESCRVIMDIFVQRTHGTYIETKGNALIWQFSDADPEFGFLQSKELEEHLHLILNSYPVEVIRGGGVSDGYIEVRPTGASKGNFMDHALQIMKSSGIEADFILAVGDDNSDEPMFERIESILHENPHLSAFSVTVGKKPTAAKAYVDDPAAVMELLTTLSKTAQRDKRYFSSMDLPSMSPSGSGKHLSLNFNLLASANTMTMTSGGYGGASMPRSSSLSHFSQTSELQHKKEEVHAHDIFSSQTSLPNSPSLRAVPSNPAISMAEYMHGLNESNEEDAEGIFF
eukprot:scaffold1084_cov250-Ochromonas_danica.AAC.12